MSFNEQWKIVLEGVFQLYGMSMTNTVFHVVLVEDQGLFYQKVKPPDAEVDIATQRSLVQSNLFSGYECLQSRDIVGCLCMRDQVRTPSVSESVATNDEVATVSSVSAYFCIYAYPIRKQMLTKCLKRRRVSLTFVVNHCDSYNDNIRVARMWKRAIRCLSHGTTTSCGSVRMVQGTRNVDDTPSASQTTKQSGFPCPLCQNRRLLIFVNPSSGPGKALKIFQERVVPVLAEAGISYDVIVTETAKAAQKHIKSADLNQFHGIVIVSGDGLIFEVINGLMDRPDWPSAIQIPLGVVPGGSGNGLAKAISHASREPLKTNPRLLAAFNIAKGRAMPMDIIRVVTPRTVLHSFLSVGWGIIADIDIESEMLRALGETRFTLWAIARIIDLRIYKGRLSYLPAKDPEGRSNGVWKSQKDSAIHKVHSAAEDIASESVSGRLQSSQSCPSQMYEHLEDNYSELSDGLSDSPLQSVSSDDVMDNSNTTRLTEKIATNFSSLLPPLHEPVPDNWVQSEDDFILVYFVFQSHISSNAFVAPEALPDDGVMWMIVIRKGVTRPQLINFLLAIDSGSHINLPFVEVRRVHAFRLEPITEGGHLTVDGEVVDYGPLQAEVMQGVARIMTH